MNFNRKPLFFALALSLAAPLAFAQSAAPQSATPQSAPQSTTTQSTDTQSTSATTTQDANAAIPATPATPAVKADAMTGATAATPATSASPQKKNWSELDVDKNGSLSATEAQPVQSLSKAFLKADANADGQLTQDEYKAYLAANGKAKASSGSGG